MVLLCLCGAECGVVAALCGGDEVGDGMADGAGKNRRERGGRGEGGDCFLVP